VSQGTLHPDGPDHPEPREEDPQPSDIAEAYRRAHADGQGLGEEFEGWEHEGFWDGLEP
jgi:hypothetical protein